MCACSSRGGDEKCVQSFSRKSSHPYTEDLDIYWRIILKWNRNIRCKIMAFVHFAQDKFQLWDFVIATMNLKDAIKGRKFLEQLRDYKLLKNDFAASS